MENFENSDWPLVKQGTTHHYIFGAARYETATKVSIHNVLVQIIPERFTLNLSCISVRNDFSRS